SSIVRVASGVAGKQVQPAWIDPAEVASSHGHAMAVKELEDLDRHLAAVVEPVAQLGGAEEPVGSVEVGGDLRDLAHGIAQEEVVVRDLMQAAHAREQLAQAPHVG